MTSAAWRERAAEDRRGARQTARVPPLFLRAARARTWAPIASGKIALERRRSTA
eukprot:CAMPEP_0196700388 /NCGR_PEP_ID=MMETSP1090-20130531/49172_1 /TAXON_ID=37098 /ORGANISM="Isochrysis sp, Strain CCMP1244" /LENGTH=53 /DNA_ID=CAMNT_0042040119 /DNA_START=52 /DNA_END=210 /DNA_ORIENTATION=+